MVRLAPRKLPQKPESMNTTTDQIRALLAESTQRAESATEGPWKLWGMTVMTDRDGSGQPREESRVASTSDPDRGLRTWNASFIAAARTALPARDRALLIAVEALEKASGYHMTADRDIEVALAAILAALQGEGGAR